MFLLALSLFSWFLCFYFNRNGNIIPKIGGGCFGGQPQINIPQAPQLPTAQEIFQDALSFNQDLSPLALGAREEALGIISDPTRFLDFVSSFQPTSQEQAIADSQFANLLDTATRQAGQQSSLRGIDSAFPALFERAITPGLIDIGTYLTNLGTARAGSSLSSRLAIDPNAVLQPFVQTAQIQSTNQANLDRNQQLLQAQADFQNALNADRGLGRLIGAGLGAVAAPFTGGLSLLPAIGIGSSIGGLFEGDFGIGDALSLAGGLGGSGGFSFNNPFASGAGIGGGGGFSNFGDLLDTSGFGTSIIGGQPIPVFN